MKLMLLFKCKGNRLCAKEKSGRDRKEEGEVRGGEGERDKESEREGERGVDTKSLKKETKNNEFYVAKQR